MAFMTLILTLVDRNRIVQVSDRRLAKPYGELHDDNANKAVIVGMERINFAATYTEVAFIGRQREEGLYRQLDEHKMLIKPQSLDEEGWESLQRGDSLEISGTLRIPEIVKMLGVARDFDKLLPFIEQLGVAGEMGLSEEDREMLGLIRMFGELGDPESSPNAGVVVVELPASPSYSFVATLKRKFLEGSLAELEGEITILGKIQRKINEGDPPIGIEQLVPGLEGLRGLHGLGSHEPQQATYDNLSISRPACTLIPIGIYLRNSNLWEPCGTTSPQGSSMFPMSPLRPQGNSQLGSPIGQPSTEAQR
jgi:hypothetical protein